MTGFSIKIPDRLNDALGRHLDATGQTRSAFVRGLIEQALDAEQARQAELKARAIELLGRLGNDAEPATNTALDTNRTLLEEGYGLGHAHRRDH